MKRTVVAAVIASICTLGHPLLTEAGGRSFTRSSGSSRKPLIEQHGWGRRITVGITEAGAVKILPNNGGWQNNGGSQNNGGWQNNNGWQRNSQGTNNGYGGWNQQSSPNTNGGWTGGYQGGRQTNSFSQSKSGPSGNKMNVVPFSGSNKSANSSNQQTVMKPVQPGSGGSKKQNGVGMRRQQGRQRRQEREKGVQSH